MNCEDNEEKRLRAAVFQKSQAVLQARGPAEGDLIQTKDSLQHTTELLSNILASITDGFISFDLEWRIIYLNRRAAEMLRPLYPAKELLMGKVHWEAFPETVGTPLEEHYRRAL
ncbi:MAG: PAS domain-containing protein, partial [Limisphaerales bacterium]